MTATNDASAAAARGCNSLAPACIGSGRKIEDAGCVVVISHDRWFLDRIATHILSYEGESKVTFFDETARVGGRRARRGLHAGRQEPRVAGGRRARRRPTRARCSRNFSEYEEWRKQRLGDAATRPHRITFRRLTR